MDSKHFLGCDVASVRTLAAPELERLGLSWDHDVEDILPVLLPATKLFLRDFPNPHIRVVETSSQDLSRFEAALKASLERLPTYRSIAIDAGGPNPVFVVLRCNARYFKAAVTPCVEVDDGNALMKIRLPSQHRKGELPRGLLFRAIIARRQDLGTLGLLQLVCHAVMDAVVVTMWQHFFAVSLRGGIPSDPVPYGTFLNMYHSNMNSQNAQQAIRSHLKRLTGISALEKSVFPPLAPVGDRVQTALPQTLSESTGKLEAVELYAHISRHYLSRRVPMLRTCRQQGGARPSIICKAAIVIYNCLMTDSNTAMMLLLLGGRSWPFVDDSISRLLPNPNEVAGPTKTSAIDVTKLDWKETIGRFLKRLDQEQKELLLYVHCPPGLAEMLNEADRAMLPKACRQVMNWVPKFANADIFPEDASTVWPLLHKAYQVEEPTDSLTWTIVFLSKDEIGIEVARNAALTSEDKAKIIISKVFDIIEVLCDVEAWSKELLYFKVRTVC